MAQTTYSASLSAGLAGLIADAQDCVIESYPASEAIPFGRMVELDGSGGVRLPQTATAVGPLVGIAAYSPEKEPDTTGGGYAIGEMVPCVRRGKVWAVFTGTSPGNFEVMNVKSSSTTSTDRGKLTDAATSATAGSEVYAASGLLSVRSTNLPTGLALVEINFPQ